MIHIRLPEGEAQGLEFAYRQETDPKYRDRIQIVRLASRDRPHPEIAQDLAITPRTVQRWLNRYLNKGRAGLRPRKAQGAPGKIPAGLADEIRRWVIDGPAQQGLDRANWTHQELADHLYKTHGIATSRSAMQRFCHKIGSRVYRPTYHYLRGNPEKQEQAKKEIAALKSQAEAGEIVLLSQDEARLPMVPTLQATLGVKGHRPKVGTWDCKDLMYLLGVVNLISGALHGNTLECPKDAKKKTGQSKTARLQEALAQHLRHVGRVYSRDKYPEVVLLLDNAPWHAGKAGNAALADNPHLRFKRLPSYSPQLNPIERLWKVLTVCPELFIGERGALAPCWPGKTGG